MAAANVESQRLISLSLGKIAQSRSQKGGINLHKNLLVATVLHKARTACMMEYHTLQRQRQLEFQQRQQQQQQKDAAALEFEAKQEQARSAALSLAAFNTSQQQNTIPTCVTEMEEEAEASASPVTGDGPASPASDPVPRDSSSNLGQVTVSSALRPSATGESGTGALATDLDEEQQYGSISSSSEAVCSDMCNKENSPPSHVTSDAEELKPDTEDTLDTQVVPQSSVPTPSDHLAAATQLAVDAAGLSPRCSDLQQKSCTSASPTCNVLKRQRENHPSHDQECPPASKRARLVAVRRDSCAATKPESAANSDISSDQHTPATDSSQISNLVSIFNSGFTGLCAVSQTPPSRETSSSSLSYESVSAQYTTLSPAQPDSLSISQYSRKLSESSLSCSSSLGRLDSVQSSLGLVLSV